MGAPGPRTATLSERACSALQYVSRQCCRETGCFCETAISQTRPPRRCCLESVRGADDRPAPNVAKFMGPQADGGPKVDNFKGNPDYPSS